MAPEFVDRIRGSRWVQAQPARPIIRREFCGFEEPSRFDLWRLGSCAIRRQQVEPGTARRTNFGGGLGEQSAGPTVTCCRQAEPAPTCYRRTEHEIGNHKLEFPISSNSQASLRIFCRHCLPG